MERFQVLVALIIGFGVAFAVQNGTGHKSPNNSPPANPPASDSPKNQPPPNQPSSNEIKNQETNNDKLEKSQTEKPSGLSPEDPKGKPVQNDKNKPENGQNGAKNPPDRLANQPIADDDLSNDYTDSESDGNDATEHKHKDHDHSGHRHEHHNDKSTLNDSNVNYILLVSYYRSGSSFVGDLLQQPDGKFYTFEPFKFFDYQHKVDSDDEESALRILQNIFQCSLDQEDEYLDWICDQDKTEATISIKRNHFLWESCESDNTMCCDPDYIDKVCSKTPIRIIKETRLTLKSVEKLLQRLPESVNIKVVFLVRDPRGIYNSKKHFKWCKNTSCIDYEQLCEDLTSDLEVYPRLVNKYGKKVMILRFEDLALEPFLKGEALYKSLGLSYTSDISDFIDTHTDPSVTVNDSFAVIHNPRDLITKWTTKLNETIVDSIQDSCKTVIEQLGYKPVVLSEMPEPSDEDITQVYNSVYSLPNRL